MQHKSRYGLSILLIALLVFSLVSCGESESMIYKNESDIRIDKPTDEIDTTPETLIVPIGKINDDVSFFAEWEGSVSIEGRENEKFSISIFECSAGAEHVCLRQSKRSESAY